MENCSKCLSYDSHTKHCRSCDCKVFKYGICKNFMNRKKTVWIARDIDGLFMFEKKPVLRRNVHGDYYASDGEIVALEGGIFNDITTETPLIKATIIYKAEPNETT